MRIYRYTSVYLYTSTVVKITSIGLNMDKHCGFLKSLSNYVTMCYKYSHTVICIPFYHRVVRKNDNPFGGIQLIDLTEVKTNIFLDYSIISIFCVVVTIFLHLANFVSIYFFQCVISNTLAFILFFFQCKTHYNSIISDLNKKCLFQNYPVFSSLKWRCILLCTVTTAFNLILIASLFLSDSNSSYLRNKTYSIDLKVPFIIQTFQIKSFF